MKKLLLVIFGGVVTFGQELAFSSEGPRSRTTHASDEKSASPTLATNYADLTKRLGLTAMEYGHIEKDEDDRLFANIKNANNIKVLVSNGYNLVNNLKAEFTEFLGKPGSSMQVIFATADSDFYREETEITLGFKPGEEAYNKNLGLVSLDRGRLEGYAGPQNRDRLSFRYFNTQYRLPIIIIDNRYCYLTIRLSPNESSQSLRMEFDQGYAKSCIAHFDKMWALSSPNPESSHWLAALGLASWSRTELMTLVACIGTLLAGVGAFLAVPSIQRLLRLEKRFEAVSPETGNIINKSDVVEMHNENVLQRGKVVTSDEHPSISAPTKASRRNKHLNH